MNADVLSVRSAAADLDEPARIALPSTAVGIASVSAAGSALVVAGRDANVAIVVVACLAVVWSAAGIYLAIRHRCPAASIALALAAAMGLGALSWSWNVGNPLTGTNAWLADLGQRLALTLVPAIVFHLALTLPDGRIGKVVARRLVYLGYAIGASVGLGLLADRDQVRIWPLILLWLAVPLAAPAAHSHYRAAGVADQRRMQWIGWAGMVATEVAMLAAALSLVAGWPNHEGAIAVGSTGLVPLAMIAGTVPRLQARVDRLLTHTVSLAGLTALIVVAYLLALAAFGRRPVGSERTLLLLSMLAAAGAAIVYHPARAWLTDRANRVVYGERIPPDERFGHGARDSPVRSRSTNCSCSLPKRSASRCS